MHHRLPTDRDQGRSHKNHKALRSCGNALARHAGYLENPGRGERHSYRSTACRPLAAGAEEPQAAMLLLLQERPRPRCRCFCGSALARESRSSRLLHRHRDQGRSHKSNVRACLIRAVGSHKSIMIEAGLLLLWEYAGTRWGPQKSRPERAAFAVGLRRRRVIFGATSKRFTSSSARQSPRPGRPASGRSSRQQLPSQRTCLRPCPCRPKRWRQRGPCACRPGPRRRR